MKFEDLTPFGILRFYNNRLKKIENVLEKNRIEADFYNRWAEKYLASLTEKELRENRFEELPPRYRYFYSLIGNVRGRRILNCCCGDGRGTTIFAKQGALVYNIDIAENMIELARIRAKVNKVSNRFKFSLMSAEQMGFKDSQFDVVLSLGALHHLQPYLAGSEIARVLRPGGKAIFLEPLANSKVLLLMRGLVPIKCCESPGGGGMKYSDIHCIGRFFCDVKCREFLVFQRLVRLKPFQKIKKQLERLDTKILSEFPFMRRYAGGIVIQFDK